MVLKLRGGEKQTGKGHERASESDREVLHLDRHSKLCLSLKILTWVQGECKQSTEFIKNNNENTVYIRICGIHLKL